MRWLVTGATGMLGQDMVTVLADAGEQVVAMGHSDLDITEEPAVQTAVSGFDAVVNCAAWTAVDKAETCEADAFEVNARGPSILARATCRSRVRLVHMSTDYVFDGHAREPYAHDHPPWPRSAYGRTKAAGEWAVQAMGGNYIIVRTAWLYGAGGSCFPKSIAQTAANDKPLEVVDDQVGQPTWSADLAGLVLDMVTAGVPPGVYHGVSSGETTWHEFARVILESAGHCPDNIRPISSGTLALPARRPAYSVLSCDRLQTVGVQPLGDWKDRWHAAQESVLVGDAPVKGAGQ